MADSVEEQARKRAIAAAAARGEGGMSPVSSVPRTTAKAKPKPQAALSAQQQRQKDFYHNQRKQAEQAEKRGDVAATRQAAKIHQKLGWQKTGMESDLTDKPGASEDEQRAMVFNVISGAGGLGAIATHLLQHGAAAAAEAAGRQALQRRAESQLAERGVQEAQLVRPMARKALPKPQNALGEAKATARASKPVRGASKPTAAARKVSKPDNAALQKQAKQILKAQKAKPKPQAAKSVKGTGKPDPQRRAPTLTKQRVNPKKPVATPPSQMLAKLKETLKRAQALKKKGR